MSVPVGFTITYRQRRGWCLPSRSKQMLLRSLIAKYELNPELRELEAVRRALPKADLDVHLDTFGDDKWYIRAFGDVPGLQRGQFGRETRRHRTLAGAIKQAVAWGRK